MKRVWFATALVFSAANLSAQELPSDPFKLENSKWSEAIVGLSIQLQSSNASQDEIVMHYQLSEGDTAVRYRLKLKPEVRRDGHKIDGIFEIFPSPFSVENNGCTADWLLSGSFKGCFARDGNNIHGVFEREFTLLTDETGCRQVPIINRVPATALQYSRVSSLEESALTPLQSDSFMTLPLAEVVEQLIQFPGYEVLFQYRMLPVENRNYSSSHKDRIQRTLSGYDRNDYLRIHGQLRSIVDRLSNALLTVSSDPNSGELSNPTNLREHITTARRLQSELERSVITRGWGLFFSDARFHPLDCDYELQPPNCPAEKDGYLRQALSELNKAVWRATKPFEQLPGALLYDQGNIPQSEAANRSVASDAARQKGPDRTLVQMTGELTRIGRRLARFYSQDREYCDDQLFLTLEAEFFRLRKRLFDHASDTLALWQRDRNLALTTLATFQGEIHTYTEYKILKELFGLDLQVPTSYSDLIVMIAEALGESSGYDLPEQPEFYANLLESYVSDVIVTSNKAPKWLKVIYGNPDFELSLSGSAREQADQRRQQFLTSEWGHVLSVVGLVDDLQKIVGGAYDLDRLARLGELKPVSGNFDAASFFTNWEICFHCNPEETLPTHLRARERAAYLLPLYLRYEWVQRVVEGPLSQALKNERSRRFTGEAVVHLEPDTTPYRLNFDPLVGRTGTD